MSEKVIAPWKKALGYSLFSSFAFTLAMALTFPYDAISERVKSAAEDAGLYLRIGSLGPGLFGVRAKGVKLARAASANADKAPEAIEIDSISVRPTLFPPGLKVSASAFDGSAGFSLGGFTLLKLALGGKPKEGSSVGVDAVIDDFDLSKGNLKGFSGVDLAGKVDASLSIDVPVVQAGTLVDFDLSTATGKLSLETKAVTVNGGTINATIPTFGPDPTPLDLPKISVGDINGKFKFDKGQGNVDTFTLKSTDIEGSVTGTVKLGKRVEYSEPNLEVRFKPDPEFQKRLGLIGSALSLVGADPKDPTYRMGRLTGTLGRPTFR